MGSKNESNRLARECIVKALIELIKTTDYASITITDITKKAGVSRMAYYRNYTSKEDILDKYMDEVGQEIHCKITEGGKSENMYSYAYTLFESLGNYSEVGVAACKANLGELILVNITKNMFKTFPLKPDLPASKYKLYFFAGAFYNIFMEWLKGGKKESCEFMAEICSDVFSGNNLTDFSNV